MTPPLTTALPARAAVRPHPRGVFTADHTFPGQKTYRIYNCVGRLLERREVPFILADGQTMASMEWTLEHYCPRDAVKHAVTCVDAAKSPPPVLTLMDGN